MSATFDRCADAVVEAIRAGASIADAARQANCSPRTVDRWLLKGRTDPGGRYGRFAAQVDATRREQGLPGTDEQELMSDAELKRVATHAARNGSVAAMKLVHTLRAEEPKHEGPDALDRLIAGRKARRGES